MNPGDPTCRGRWLARGRRLLQLVFLLLVTYEIAFGVLQVLFPLPRAAFDRYGSSPFVRAADGTPMHVGLTHRGERLIPRRAGEMSVHVLHAAVAAEDRRFFEHAGVDLRAIARAAWVNVSGPGGRQGASTITMQLARLLDPQARSFRGKLIQAFRALQLERRHEKPLLLARYLDLAPFGGNLRGVGAAAESYFGKSAGLLTAAEAALLISLLPAPTRFAPWRSAEDACTRRNRVLDAMLREGYLTRAEHADACALPLGLRRTHFPDLAPHAWLRARNGDTSIDPLLQRAVENIVAAQDTATGEALDGVAVVVVENATLAIRALVGAARPDARLLDATRRPRSAGSTLKPFLYALALDRGLITLDTPLLDLPWQSGDWSPSNFDQSFRGPVPARRALSESFNLPAVRLAAALPPGAFLGVLRASGFAHLRSGGRGRSIDLALGTDDVTVLELAGAYAALANGGRYRAPWVCAAQAALRETPAESGTRICSVGAAALITSALAEPGRARPQGAAREGVAWKTGTSSNRRDAWAAGYTRQYTVVVWRGQLNGRSHPDLIGSRTAVPVFFSVLHAVEPAPRPFSFPRQLKTIRVCVESGLRATEACDKTNLAQVPSGAALMTTCRVHRRLLVEAGTGALCCAACRSKHTAKERVFAIYPPEHAAWRVRADKPVEVIPRHAKGCEDPLSPSELRPVFVRPRAGQRVASHGATARVLVRALAPPGEGPLALLIDGVSVGKVESGAQLRPALPVGPHTLTLMSPRGLHSTVRIVVSPAAAPR